jgi:transcriptional repressor NrdR
VRCPYCSDSTNRVIDSRLGREGMEIRRRRECAECQQRFTTRERVDGVLPKIVKRDERREEYQRQKLITAVQKACEKRPVSVDALERLLDRVERHLQDLGQKEVTSRLIGERVMEGLVELDPLAAARFASVFLDFQGAEDYTNFFAAVKGQQRDPGSSR